MPTIFSRVPRAQIERTIITMSFDNRVSDARSLAVKATNDFNSIAQVKLADAAFTAAVANIAAKLTVPMANVPSDLSTLTDAQVSTLAADMELARWDFDRRREAIVFNHDYWTIRGVAPTTAEYVATLLTLMNYVRAGRGLPAVT